MRTGAKRLSHGAKRPIRMGAKRPIRMGAKSLT